MPELGSSRLNSNNTTSRNLLNHPSNYDSRMALPVNVNKLPKLTGSHAMAIVDETYEVNVGKLSD